MKVSSFGLSETGLVRENNEDVWGGIVNDNFFVLADGMGGHLAGEIAAREAVNILCKYVRRYLQHSDRVTPEQMEKVIQQAIRDVNTEIFIMSTASEECRGMGTTLCCLYLNSSRAVIGHVGDSRIYRFRDQKLSALTHDHSLLTELVDSGRIDEEEREESKFKNIITKAIGTDPFVEPDVKSLEIQLNDLFLLCSDGLTDLHSDEEIQEILSHHTNVQDSAEELVASSLSRGGIDNVTVIVVRIESIES